MAINYDNRRYLIIPTSITGSINFTQVLETSIDTVRLSVDETKTFVKYMVVVEPIDRTETYINPETNEEETVTILAGVYGRPSIYNDEYDEYTHSEFLTVLSTGEWTSPMEEV